MPRIYVRKSLSERLLSHIRFDENGHWLWTAYRNRDGYGTLGKGGKYGGMMLAHRASYELFVGRIPKGTEIDHLCRTPACVNPMHLEVVIHKVNLHRGSGFASVEAAKTHCPQGHAYEGDNVVIYAGSRVCRICHNEQSRQGYHRRRENVS